MTRTSMVGGDVREKHVNVKMAENQAHGEIIAVLHLLCPLRTLPPKPSLKFFGECLHKQPPEKPRHGRMVKRWAHPD